MSRASTRAMFGGQIIHGNAVRAAKTPEWRVWASMRSRCLSKTAHNAHRYAGRGISVCERWDDFVNFLTDMGTKPSADHTLDRIDNNRGYEPGNCRWATKSEQARNRRNNRLVTIDGRTQCMAAWEQERGINHSAVKARLKLGWTYEEALTRPIQKQRNNRANR